MGQAQILGIFISGDNVDRQIKVPLADYHFFENRVGG